MGGSPEETRNGRLPFNVRALRRALSVRLLSSKLHDARAALPRCRPSLPSLEQLRSKLPTRMRSLSTPSDSHDGSSDRAASPLVVTPAALQRACRSISAKAARLQRGDNQREAAREGTLAAALAWTESLEARESACAYALGENQHGESNEFNEAYIDEAK